MSAASPVWLITGCSSGFGRELARVVLGHGHRVVATARNTNKLQEFAANPNVLAAQLDVTDPGQIAALVAQAQAHFGAIDVLVNNAGYLYFSAIEAGADAEARAIFETNFYGPLNLIKAVLPGMRARRRGHIVNISSTGGQVGMPGIGYYNASKFALEGLSEALFHECTPLGIKVIIVEPGPFKTEWAGGSLRIGTDVIADYAQTVGARLTLVQQYGSGPQPGDPARAAAAIFTAVQSPAPPSRLVLGRSGYNMLQKKIEAFSHELETWRELSLSTDFQDQ
jgi:NAD(P)-dependent dehydrogenase (short-subunit alcohol dehydrogenase family)